MNIVPFAKSLMLSTGSAPILYLMIALSVLSLAVMLERAWVFATLHADRDALARDLRSYLLTGDLGGAEARMRASKSCEAAIVAAGLAEAPRGAEAAAEAMAGATTLQRLRLEHRL